VARAQVDGLTEGEQWARDLLDGLRAGRFGARAWREFGAESLRRARVVRARRPDVVRQSRRWGAVGLAAAVPFGPRPMAWWAAWWALVDWHIGMLETPGGDPRPLGLPDALTLARLWAAPVARQHPSPALVAAALLTDLADGALARRAGPTRLGRDLDSTADTLLFDQALRGAVERRGLDPAVLTFERARLAIGAAVVCASYFGRSEPTPRMADRELAAWLAAGGLLLASAGRPRAAERLLGAAIGYRALIRVRSSRPESRAGAA
jgi:phosphatidylglycerophosphate synthase